MLKIIKERIQAWIQVRNMILTSLNFNSVISHVHNQLSSPTHCYDTCCTYLATVTLSLIVQKLGGYYLNLNYQINLLYNGRIKFAFVLNLDDLSTPNICVRY